MIESDNVGVLCNLHLKGEELSLLLRQPFSPF